MQNSQAFYNKCSCPLQLFEGKTSFVHKLKCVFLCNDDGDLGSIHRSTGVLGPCPLAHPWRASNSTGTAAPWLTLSRTATASVRMCLSDRPVANMNQSVKRALFVTSITQMSVACASANTSTICAHVCCISSFCSCATQVHGSQQSSRHADCVLNWRTQLPAVSMRCWCCSWWVNSKASTNVRFVLRIRCFGTIHHCKGK